MGRILKALGTVPRILQVVQKREEQDMDIDDPLELEVAQASAAAEAEAAHKKAERWLEQHPRIDGLYLVQCAQVGTRLLERILDENLVATALVVADVKVRAGAGGRHSCEEEEQHWVLEPFLARVMARKHSLASILTVTGAVERCRVSSLLNDHDLITHQFLCDRVPEHQVVDDRTSSLEDCDQSVKLQHQGTSLLLHMLCEQLPVRGTMLKVILSNFELVPQRRRSGEPPQSQMLLDACVLRVVQLVEASMRAEQERGKARASPGNAAAPMEVGPQSLQELYGSWWGEWVRFGYQFFQFVESQVIDFEAFVCALSQARLRGGQAMKSNAIIWLLSQCLPIEPLKEYFKNDVLVRNCWMTSIISNMYSKEQAAQSKFAIRDSAIDCLIYRIRTAVSAAKQNPFVVEDPSGSLSDVTRHRQWWQENKNTIDMRSLSFSDQISICLLSSFSSEPIARKLCHFLASSGSPSPQLLPGGLKCNGDSTPLPTLLLACLAIKSRQRVLDTLEQLLYSRTPPEATALGLVETYCRLMALAATHYQGLISFLRTVKVEEAKKLQTVIESVSYRLLPLLAFNKVTKYLTSDLCKLVATCQHHQLFENVEIVQLKVLWSLDSLVSFKSYLSLSQTDMGPMLNRVSLLSLARGLQLRRLSDFTLTEKLPDLFSEFNTVHHVWEKQTLRFFPKRLQVMYEQYHNSVADHLMHNTAGTVSLPDAVAALQANPQMTYDDNVNVDSLVDYFTESRERSRVFLCVVWLLRSNSQGGVLKPTKDIVHRVLDCVSPQDMAHCVYSLVDFVLDEALPRTAKSKAGAAYYSQAAEQNKIVAASSIISSFVWHEEFLPFEEAVMALTDRMGDPNAVVLLQSLLLTDGNLRKRVNLFCETGMNWRHWEEEQCFEKQQQFFAAFPLKLKSNEPALPVYYGNVCLQFLPVCDYLLCRLIEFENGSLFDEIIETFLPLYTYHHMPVKFVRDTLFYYYSSPFMTSSRKSKLLSLLSGRDFKWSPELTMALAEADGPLQFMVGSGGVGSNFGQEYFAQAVSALVAVTDTSRTSETKKTIPLHAFQELGTNVDTVLSRQVLELLVIDMSPADIVNQLLLPLSMAPPHINVSFSQLNAIALLIASLPRDFVKTAILSCVTVLAGESTLTDMGALADTLGAGPFTSRNFKEHSHSEASKLTTHVECAVTLLHSMFFYSSIEVFSYFPEVVTFTRSKVLSFQHLYILCKLVGPWIYRIRTNSALFDSVCVPNLPSLSLSSLPVTLKG